MVRIAKGISWTSNIMSDLSCQWRSQDLHMEGVRGGSGRGFIPSRKGVRGYHPRENFRNLTTLMCILETEIFTFVLHVQLNLIQRKSELL
jgi:hypothetical protein